jgi:hypothetical protein
MLGEFSDRYASEGADTLLHFSQRRFNLLPIPCVHTRTQVGALQSLLALSGR